MTDKSIRIFQAITDIDQDIIEEAQSSTAKKRPAFAKILAVAASFCVMATGAFLMFSQNRLPINPPQSEVVQPQATQEAQSTPNAIDGTSAPLDYSEIKYSSLALPAAEVDPSIAALDGTAAMIDVLPFDEAFLSECCGILEGTITAIYPKHYTFDYYDDKFGEMELFHSFSDSIVYELEIEKVWYGTAFAEGTTVLIEDQSFFPDSYFSLMAGRSYVLPIYEYGDTVRTFATGEIASGDLSRDSVFSTEYPFHPQITRTEDGNYLVTTDWPSLTAEPCRVVNMGEESYDGLYKDQLRLLYAEDFAERMMTLIHTRLELK